MEPQNGSTEVWLGTHASTTLADQEGAHGDRASGRIKAPLLAERRNTRAPSQPVVKKGSIIVRDLRLWHGGKPNLSEEPRVMLALSKCAYGLILPKVVADRLLVHFAPWYRNQMEVEFAEELRERVGFEKNGLAVAARFIKEEELVKNYLNRPYGNAYDFNQTPQIEGVF
jgi:hypothetical protein